MRKKGISLVGIKDLAVVERILTDYPSAFFELSYAADAEWNETLYPYIKNRCASVHALSPRKEFFPNFASADKSVLNWSVSALMENVRTAHRFGADIIVIHPGYLCSSLVPSENKKRAAFLKNGCFDPYILHQEGAICLKDYTHYPIYREYSQRMFEFLAALCEKMLKEEGIYLAVENLNPRSGYMFIEPYEMIKAAEEYDLFLNLDVGHLFISANHFGFDYLKAMKDVIETGHVVSSHLHSNPSSTHLEDTHESLDSYDLPYKETLSSLEGRCNMIIEAVSEPFHNLDLLFRR